MIKETFKDNETQSNTWFPRSVDINPTAKCNLHCSFCWGPDHEIPDGLDTDQWKSVISFFVQRGTNGLVLTGGEPLIRKDLPEIARFAKGEGMHITLSTNTLLLPSRGQAILPHIDEIGIPLDGSTEEMNKRMRLGDTKHFLSTLNALDYLRTNHPDIEITLRTVISNVNKDDITRIGELLMRRETAPNRWKIYQFSPVSIGASHRDEHDISDIDFRHISENIMQMFPNLTIVAYPTVLRTGKYVFIGPEGNVFGVSEGGDYSTMGNMLSSSTAELLSGIKNLVRYDRNVTHAQSNLNNILNCEMIGSLIT